MIIDKTHNVATNLTGSVEFGLGKDAAHIFSMLGKFLYKEKERSVMTELCSNALDAHKLVGKESTPIRVQLPTDLQKEFKVRDFGPGLSESHVYEFLTMFGASGKRDSNDFIGGFGIGAKSPAAVTDSWSINSFHGGLETQYLIHINDKGVPTINKLFSKVTVETGLEVIVPTKTINDWRDAALKTFMFYDVKPDIKGGNSLTFNTPKYTLNYKNLFSVKDQYSSGHSVIMNRREYPLISTQVKINDWFQRGVVYNFNTSELSVSLSREDLQYESKTKDKIAERSRLIETELLADWKHEVSQAISIFDYRLKAKEFMVKYWIRPNAAEWLSDKAGDLYADEVSFQSLDSFNISLGICVPVVQQVSTSKTKNIATGRYGISSAHVSLSEDRKTKEVTISFICAKPNSIVFVEKDAVADSIRCRAAYENAKFHKDVNTVLLVDTHIWNKIPNDFYKIKASGIDKPVVVRVAKSKVISELWVRYGNHFERVDESSLNKQKQYVCVKFKNATSASSIDVAHSGFVEEFKQFVDIIYIKDDKSVPTWTMTPEAWVLSEYNLLDAKKDDIVMSFKKNQLASQNRSTYGAVGFITTLIANANIRHKHMTHKTVFGGVCKDIDDVLNSKVDQSVSNMYNKLNKLGKFLSKANIFVLDFSVQSEYIDPLKQAYPLFRLVESKWLDATLSNDLIEYFNFVGV